MPAMLTAGALYGLFDAADDLHPALAAALDEIEPPLVVVAPVLSDALRLAERLLGREAALRLIDATTAGEILLQPLERRDLVRARQVLAAEAAVGPSAALALAAAERLGIGVVLAAEPGVIAAAERLGFATQPKPRLGTQPEPGSVSERGA